MGAVKTVKAVSYAGIAHAVEKNRCPICNALKDFESSLLESAKGPKAVDFCNYHGWLLARAARADVAAGVFRNLLQLWKEAKTVAAVRCEFCQKLREEEKAVLAELADQLSNSTVAELMEEHGTVCLAHGVELSTRLPASSQNLLARIVARRYRDLDADLAAFAKIAEAGHHVGGGVLGHAAEFLFSQRGISHEEAPCSSRDPQKR
jgi:hypothetical protein